MKAIDSFIGPGSSRRFAALIFLITFIANTNILAEDNPYSNIGLGEFSGRSVTYHNLLRPHDVANAGEQPTLGAMNASVSFGYGNIYADDKSKYLIDGEWLFIDVDLNYTINKQLEFGITFPMSSRDGGFLDGGIESFHDAVGLSQQGRDIQMKNEAAIRVVDGDAVIYSNTDSSAGINDMPIYLNWYVTQGDESRPAIMFQPRVTLPSGSDDDIEGLGEPSYGITILASKRIGKSAHYLYGTLDASYSDVETVGGMELNKDLYAGSLAWEYRLKEEMSFVCQYQSASALAKNMAEWSQEAHHVTFGIKKKSKSGSMFEFGIQQNVFRYENSTDLAIRFSATGSF